MTGRKFLPPPFYGSLRSPITGVPRARKLKLFSNVARRNPFSSWSPYKKHVRGKRNDDDRAQISYPPLLRLVPQSDHGSAARAETEAFFQYGPPQSFFQLSWLALQKARREVRATIGSLRNPITGVPRAQKLKLFSNMARPVLFRAKLARPTKSTRAGSWRKD